MSNLRGCLFSFLNKVQGRFLGFVSYRARHAHANRLSEANGRTVLDAFNLELPDEASAGRFKGRVYLSMALRLGCYICMVADGLVHGKLQGCSHKNYDVRTKAASSRWAPSGSALLRSPLVGMRGLQLCCLCLELPEPASPQQYSRSFLVSTIESPFCSGQGGVERRDGSNRLHRNLCRIFLGFILRLAKEFAPLTSSLNFSMIFKEFDSVASKSIRAQNGQVDHFVSSCRCACPPTACVVSPEM